MVGAWPVRQTGPAYLAGAQELLEECAGLADHGEEERPHDGVSLAADVDDDIAPLREAPDEVKCGPQQRRPHCGVAVILIVARACITTGDMMRRCGAMMRRCMDATAQAVARPLLLQHSLRLVATEACAENKTTGCASSVFRNWGQAHPK